MTSAYRTSVHRWLYDHPGILHRDLSSNNVICRFADEANAKGGPERKVYGVLMDYDLSSWTKDLEANCTGASQRPTGIPPYIAGDLLDGTSTTHLYRHDVESLFYVMLAMCGRYTISCTGDGTGKEADRRVVMREGNLPYERWFNAPSFSTLDCHKGSFFFARRPLALSPTFEGFRPWLWSIRWALTKGFLRRTQHIIDQLDLSHWREEQAEGLADGPEPTPAPFDEETLGGHVDYSAIIKPTRRLKGELEGLTIRYDLTELSPSAVTGAVKAGA